MPVPPSVVDGAFADPNAVPVVLVPDAVGNPVVVGAPNVDVPEVGIVVAVGAVADPPVKKSGVLYKLLSDPV